MKKSILTLCVLAIVAAFAAVPLQAHCGTCDAHADKKECCKEGAKKEECCGKKEDKKEEAEAEAAE